MKLKWVGYKRNIILAFIKIVTQHKRNKVNPVSRKNRVSIKSDTIFKYVTQVLS